MVANASLAHGGRLVFVGLVQAHMGSDDPLFHRREMTLLTGRNSCNDFPRIIQLIEAGRIDTTPWITHRLGLSEVPDQFATLSALPG
jgi:threonine dehydrogenase-like Zn-dependent dehydrogenase